MKYKTSELKLQLALVRYFDISQTMLIPNITGYNFGEADLIKVSKTGYLTEIEIKISRSDFKADQKKWAQRNNMKSKQIKYKYFAMPAFVAARIELLPKDSGLIVVSNNGICIELIKAKPNKNAIKINDKDLIKLYRNGCFKMWDSKRKLYDLEIKTARKILDKAGNKKCQ